MADDLTARLIAAAIAAIDAHADELTRLDQAIGDGDHGINMKRGFAAVAEAGDELAPLDLPATLRKIGKIGRAHV